jgi:thiol-disulfide isomerase/thioredoxin
MSDHVAAPAHKAATASAAPLARAMLQRQCACGQHTGGGECDECAKQEGLLQRKSRDGHDGDVPPVVHDVLRSSGESLDAASLRFMESSFGQNFGHVRIHADAQAQRSAEAVNAHAYTVGGDIVFGSGRYAPQTSEGKRLLAHELAHVVQQDAATPASAGALPMSDWAAGETQADQAANAAMSSAGNVASGVDTAPPGGKPVARGGSAAEVSLQREPDAASASSQSASTSGTGEQAASSACIESVAGEDIPSLLQAGVVTIVEFGAEWCGPCKINQASLEEICAKFRRQPPPVPVRIYSVDVDAAGNEEAARKYASGTVPHLYIYVGAAEKAHVTIGLEPDAMAALVAEQLDYASTSGWWRGAKGGAKWGLLPGGAVGLGGAIAVGMGAGGLTGNAQMLGILGALGGGLLAGALIGGAIGAISGASSDDRLTGPGKQKRRRLQPKLRAGSTNDPLEREADNWAARVVGDGRHADDARPAGRAATGLAPTASIASAAPARDTVHGQPLDAAPRAAMEARFGRDFSEVRVHRDSRAEAITGRMDAYAVTSGASIYFAQDAYAPGSRQGNAILGHELAHVAQNRSAAPKASEASLEAEAAQASHAVSEGRQAQIRHGSDRPMLALKRWQKTLAGVGIGAGAGGAAGALIGLGTAAATGGALGAGALIGGLIGAGVGAIAGGIAGFLSRHTTPETIPEADALIRKRFGQYLKGGATGPLHDAQVHVVSHAELCERRQCRAPGANCEGLIGWTDTGVPVNPSAGPEHQPPPIASAAGEPECNGSRMEHATPERPVIYYERNSTTLGTLIHEGLHAYSDPAFSYLHNHVSEGTTEYFTHQLQDDFNMPRDDSYEDEVASVEKLISLVGEETVAWAYFGGRVPELHQAVNARLGRCALAAWTMSLAAMEFRHADEIMEGRNQNRCNDPDLARLNISPAALTPGAATAPATDKQAPPALQRKAAGATSGDDAPAEVHDVLNSPGRPLDQGVLAFMGPRIGRDLSEVRVHTDALAARSTRAVGALAYTVGEHVVFGAGEYEPRTRRGAHTLAHELTHVAQQRSMSRFAAPRRLPIGHAGDAFEQQADAAADAIARGGAAQSPPLAAHAPSVQRLGAGNELLRFFGIEAGTFSESDLTEYLDRIAKNRQCDCGLLDFLSDDKARAIVNAWGAGKYRLDQPYKGVPAVEIKRILVQEMLSGPTGGADEKAIIKIFSDSSADHVKQLLDPTAGLDIQHLLNDVDGDNREALLGVLAKKLPDVGGAHLKQSEQPGAKSGACTIARALQIHAAQQTAEMLTQRAIGMLEQFVAKPAENSNVQRQLDCYFPGAKAGHIGVLRQNFARVSATLAQMVYICPAEPFVEYRLSNGEVYKPEEGVQARALVKLEAPAPAPATQPAKKKAPTPAAPPAAPAQAEVVLFSEFFDADPAEQSRIVIHEAFHHALKQGEVHEVYNVKCGQTALDFALTNAQSYAMFAAQLAQSGLHVELKDCPVAWQSEMIAAARTAEIWVSNAVAGLDAAIADPQRADGRTVANLRRHFKTDPTATKVVREIRGALGEIQAAFSGELPLECDSECGEDVAAKTGGLLGILPRGGHIHLCPHWFEHLDHSERAETILHEMAHRFAGKGFNELYMKDPHTAHQYYAQSTEDALGNADSFAQFARMMQQPAGAAPAEPAQKPGQEDKP